MSTAVTLSRPQVRTIHVRHSLRTRLGLATGGITLLLALLVSFTVGFTTERQLQTASGQTMAELAFQMTDKLDRGMFERYRDVQLVAALDALRDPQVSFESQRGLLEKVQTTYPNYAWIGIADSAGVVQVSTGGLLEGQSVATRPWFISGQAGPAIGDVHEAMLLAKLLPHPNNEPLRFVDVSVPIMDQKGQPRGVLGAHLSWTWAREVQQSLLQPIQGRSGVEILVLSQSGDVLLGPSGLQNQKLDLPSLRQPLGKAGQYAVERWPDGKMYLTGVQQSQGYLSYPGLGWSVVVRQPADVAFAPARQLQQQVLLLGGGLGLLFAILAWFVTGHFVKPLLAIASASDRIRQGDASVTLPMLRGQDEIAQLSSSLNTLVKTMIDQDVALRATNTQLLSELQERRRAEDALRQSEQRRQFALKAAHMGTWDWSVATDHLTWSAAIDPMFDNGHGMIDPNSSSFWSRIHPDDRVQVQSAVSHALAEKTPYDVEFRVPWADGSVRWLASKGQVRHNEHGVMVGLSGVVMDVTDRKQSEAERERLYAQAQAAIQARDEFLAVAAHELKTPVTSLRGFSQVLLRRAQRSRDGTLDVASTLSALEVIDVQSDKLTHLIEQLLDVSRIEAGRLVLNRYPVDLASVVQNVVATAQQSTDRHTLRVHAPSTMYVSADPLRIEQVVTNLVTNAIKYSPAGGPINLVVQRSDEQGVQFTVQDNGIGIPLEHREHIFDRFYQAHAQQFYSGMGLGLYISRQIVELHHGTLNAEFPADGGTRFVMRLPNEPETVAA